MSSHYFTIDSNFDMLLEVIQLYEKLAEANLELQSNRVCQCKNAGNQVLRLTQPTMRDSDASVPDRIFMLVAVLWLMYSVGKAQKVEWDEYWRPSHVWSMEGLTFVDNPEV